MFDTKAIGTAQFISAGWVRPDPAWRMSAHRHTLHELICVVDGILTVESGVQRVTATAGDVLWYPAGVVHAERTDARRPLESRFLTFACPGLDAGQVVKSSDDRGRIRQITAWLRSDADGSSPEVATERDALLQAALAEFGRGSASEDQPWVARTRAYIREHIEAPLSLSGLAKLNGLSRFHFLRAYRAATGRTPMQDVRNLRATYARELILGSNLPFKEIAPRVGLGDEYAMSRVFRKLFGVPPGRYRRNLRGPAVRLPLP